MSPKVDDARTDEIRVDATEKNERRRSRFVETLRAIVPVVIFALLFRAFVAEAYVIPSESMTPTLQVGDRIFANKISFGSTLPFTTYKLVDGRQPRRGEVIIFTDPKDGSTTLVKRVIALAGDRVKMHQHQLWINDRPVERHQQQGSCSQSAHTRGTSWLPERCVAVEEQLGGHRYRVFEAPASEADSFGPLQVPPGHVFVLGDNRDRSNDSRFWGTVPYSHIKGRALFVWWSSNDPDGVRWPRFFRSVHQDAR